MRARRLWGSLVGGSKDLVVVLDGVTYPWRFVRFVRPLCASGWGGEGGVVEIDAVFGLSEA